MPRIGLSTPFGPATLIEEAGALVALSWHESCGTGTPLLREAAAQLAAYFAGTRRTFELPIRPTGSAAQQRFGAALLRIPFGETRTYGALAAELGISPQAAGQLCAGNPLPILIPCHRVLGQESLGGFSAPGGVESKVLLLRLEGAAGLLI